ncbi:MAG: GNAT family N-acetyltransferase [Synechococcus elongatus]
MRIQILNDDGERVGYLIPINKHLASNPFVIQKLTKWRKMFKKYFLTQFTPTENRTKSWLESVVLPSGNRVLFLIYTSSNDIIGNFGICDLSEEKAELDNLIRGEKGGHPQLIYFAELSLLRWLFYDLCIPKVCLHVFSNNYKTISLHESVGFRTTASYSLAKEEHLDEIKYTPCEVFDSNFSEFSYLEMTLIASEFKKIHECLR